MKIRIISVGRPRKDIYSATADFLKRIERFYKAEHIWVRGSKLDGDKKKEQEAEQLKKYIKDGSLTIMLTRDGLRISSKELASRIGKMIDSSKDINFLIGGSDGFSSDLRTLADTKISMSAMTLQHDIALLLLTEQVYRSLTILKGLPYHR